MLHNETQRVGKFCRQLQDALVQTGYPSVYAIAREIGTGHQSIQNLLDGKTPPWRVRVETMQALCEILSLEPKLFYRPRIGGKRTRVERIEPVAALA